MSQGPASLPPSRPASARRRGAAQRARLLAGAALALLVAAAEPASAITRATIAVDGQFADWAVVLRDATNYVVDQSRSGGDPDAPQSADRDLRVFALTWDQDHLFLYFRRTDSGANSLEYLAYVDLDDDQRLGPADLVLDLKFNGSTLASVASYRYRPLAPPTPDALTGDGVDEPGGIAAPVATDLDARGSATGIEAEARISWASLGVAPGAPLNLHASIAQGTNLPSQVEDNAAFLSSRFRDLTLAADGRGTVAGPATVDYDHTVTAAGNVGDTVNLFAPSSNGLRVTLLARPSLAVMADDLNGNGVYTDLGDVLDPAFDTDSDGRPDTGPLPAGGRFELVLRVTVPGGLPNGIEDVVTLTAVSASQGTLFRENRDTTVIGILTVSPDRAKRAVAGTTVLYPHQVCNRGTADDSVDLTASSSSAFPVAVHSDPNGDGDPSDGVPITSTGVIPAGSCVSVVVVSQVPAAAPLGQTDSVTLVGSFAAAPAIVDQARDTTTVSERVTFAPGLTGVTVPGGSVFYRATITNSWFETGVFSLSATSSLGSTVTFWSDPDGNGSPSDGAPILLAGPVAPNGGTFTLLVEVTVPGTSVSGDVDTAVATAALRDDPTVRASVTDVTTVRTLTTYADPTYQRIATVYPRCVVVYTRATNLQRNERYRFEWLDALGNLRRINPANGTTPDANLQLSDSISLAITDPVGVWTVKIRRKVGNSFVDVDPGGSAEFRVTDDLGDDGGILSSLRTDKLNYVLTGDSLTATAVLENPSSITYPNTFVDYVVFRDGDGDALPTAGETYITLGGTPSPWAPGQTTCRSTGLPSIGPEERYLDASCSVSGIQFTTSGVWHLCSTWFTQCGAPIALECASFNVGCAPGDLPPADAGPSSSVCLGGSTLLGTPGQPGLTYAWSPTAFLDDPAAAQPTATPDVTLTYTLTVTSLATGCVNTSEVTVTVNPLPEPDAGPEATFCLGAAPVPIGTDPGPGFDCSWTPTAGLSGATLCQPEASPGAMTVYEVRWTDRATGCSATDTVVVRAVAPPLADAGPDASVCPGAPGTTIGTPALPGLAYRWDPPDGLNDRSAAQPVATPAAATVYTLTVTDVTSGCTSTDTVTVSVGGPVANAGGPGPLAAPALLGVGPCDPSLRYDWTPTTDLSDPASCTPIADPTTDTTYCLTVTDLRTGCVSAPDCVLVQASGAPCAASQLPAAVRELRAVKALPGRTDVHFEWLQEARSLGGYHGYAVTVKTEIPVANTTAPSRRPVFQTAASASATTADDPGAVAGSPGDEVFYQVVGVCSDGSSEGAL